MTVRCYVCVQLAAKDERQKRSGGRTQQPVLRDAAGPAAHTGQHADTAVMHSAEAADGEQRLQHQQQQQRPDVMPAAAQGCCAVSALIVAGAGTAVAHALISVVQLARTDVMSILHSVAVIQLLQAVHAAVDTAACPGP